MKVLKTKIFAGLKRWRWFAGCSLALVSPVVLAQEPRVLDVRFLDSLRLEVRTNHPSIAASLARVQAAEAGLRAVRLWEDPMAGIGVMAAERDMRADDGDLMFMAEQVLPRRRLYAARKASAAAERSILEAETRAAVLRLETLVGQTALEAALADEMLAIETNQLGWLESMAANARAKLIDPSANVSEPLRIESEVAQERQKIDSARRNRTRLIRQLNILLGRPVNEEWPVLRLPESASLAPALADQLDQLFRINPMLESLLRSADAARAEIEVARRERSPIFSVGAESSIYSRGDYRQTTIAAKLTLPFFNKSVYRANVERARQQQAAAEKEAEALYRTLRGDAVAAQTDAENASQQAATFAQEVIPRAEKAAVATENAWISSKANLLEVLDSRRVVLNARLEERRFVAAHGAALETLRSIVPSENQP